MDNNKKTKNIFTNCCRFFNMPIYTNIFQVSKKILELEYGDILYGNYIREFNNLYCWEKITSYF